MKNFSVKNVSMRAVAVAILTLTTLGMTACGNANAESNEASSSAPSSEAVSSASGQFSGPITVISREPGSGTRTAFIELFGIEVKDDSGNKTDTTTEEAMIANKTDVMLTQVSGNKDSIGYVSLGSLQDSVKALDIDGTNATAENVKNGSYKVSRPFNIATKGTPDGLSKDFIDFILSSEGQAIVSDGYIKINDSAAPYSGSKPSGKLVIAGSSSVSPVMEKLREGYLALNPSATIEVQSSDSSAGMQALKDGNCDIGMASRSLKESESAELNATEIALDGIAVIVNPENPLSGLSSEAVKGIYTGETTDWAAVK